MPRNKIPIDKTDQHLMDNWLIENLEADPPQPRRFFTNNIFTRTLAHLFGKGLQQSIALSCTEAGALKTAPIGSGFQTYDTWDALLYAPSTIVLTPTSVASRVDLWIENNNASVRHSYDGVSFGDWFCVEANSFYSFDATTGSIEIKDESGIADVTYRCIMWQ